MSETTTEDPAPPARQEMTLDKLFEQASALRGETEVAAPEPVNTSAWNGFLNKTATDSEGGTHD